MISLSEIFGYKPAKEYAKPVAYFSMEFAIDQALKIYSGGLGFLAGSHMKSAYELKQNIIGIGMLWKFGYYDQQRTATGTMKAEFVRKYYSFLTDTGIIFPVIVHNATVYVKAYLLKPSVFNSAPVFLLSTDIEQNDALSRTITNRLYDPIEATRIAQSIVLGTGGAKLLDILGIKTDIYHMNEGHALPLCFYLYAKYKDMDEVKKRVVFTTHTPEEAGNESHDFDLLSKMSFFNGIADEEIKSILTVENNRLNYTLAALEFAKIANGVSKLHGEVSRKMWGYYEHICDITHITNAQNEKYWEDVILKEALSRDDNDALIARKKQLKRELFKEVADQTGKIFDEDVLTMVWARRFAGYKRADLIMSDWEKFEELVSSIKYPIQIIWAGKPYPEDIGAINVFNQIFEKTVKMPNVAVLTGYELELSGLVKRGADVWLNNPNMYREASGTSGMTAAMNAGLNFSIPDGWVPEFAKRGHNCFIIEPAGDEVKGKDRDVKENENLYNVLTREILPMYYHKPEQWLNMVKNSMREIVPAFESGRMAAEYYDKLFNVEVSVEVLV